MKKLNAQRSSRFNYLIQTDASVRGLKSTHSYNIRGIKKDGRGGKEFRTKGFSRLFEDSVGAELYAITEALQYMQEKGFKRSIVLTDNQSIVKMTRNRDSNYDHNRYGRDIIYLRKLLDATNSIIRFQKRQRNKGADKVCHLVWKKKQFSIKGKPVKGFKSKSYNNYLQRQKEAK